MGIIFSTVCINIRLKFNLKLNIIIIYWYYASNLKGDPLYNYIKFESKTTTLSNSVVIEVENENQCAYSCTNQKNFTCKRFEL